MTTCGTIDGSAHRHRGLGHAGNVLCRLLDPRNAGGFPGSGQDGEQPRRATCSRGEQDREAGEMRLALLFLLGAGCASVPQTPEIVYRSITVPHVCAPTSDSPAFQKCKADCAMIWE